MTSEYDKLLYLRKSRADGEYESVEDVLARHEKMLQEYAVRTFGEPVPESCIYREIVSGETIRDRPMINRLLERIQSEPVTGVLTVEPQRLSRGDLSDCGTIIRAFRYTDTLIITPNKTYDLSDKFDRKFFEMELMRGNDYLEYVKEIMMRGRLASVSDGNFIGSVPAYGYDKVRIGKSCTLIPNDEADTVRLIFELFVSENLGTSAIAHRLDELGIKPRKSPFWTSSAIRDMLRNPVYTGKIRWNQRKTVKKYDNGELLLSRPVSAPENSMLIDGKHEAIISDELFDAARKKFGRVPRSKPGKELVNPFASLLRCGCGRAMVYQAQKRSSARVHCTQQMHCGNKSAAFDEIAYAVVCALRDTVTDLSLQTDNIEKSASSELYAALSVRLNKELDSIEAQQSRLYDLLEQGIYTKTLFSERNAALAERREKVKASLEETALQDPVTDCYEAKTITLSQAIAIMLSTKPSAKQKNDFLKCIVKEIRYCCQTDNRTKWDNTPFSLDIFIKF